MPRLAKNSTATMRQVSRWTLIAMGLFMAGCDPRQDYAESNQPPDAGHNTGPVEQKTAPATANESFIFRAKYLRTAGPCIPFGNGLIRPMVDVFEVEEVLQGELAAKSINVHAMTEGGEDYPANLVDGQIYTLKLSPSKDTTEQLQENCKNGHVFLWIHGNEIRTHAVPPQK